MTTPPPPEPEALPTAVPEPPHPPGSETLAAITALGSALAEAPPPRRVRQIISLVLLSALLLGFAYLFFQVIHTLFLPLFIAAILALVLHPTQQALAARLGGRDAVAALLILLGLLLVLIVPALYLGMFSYETLATGIQKMERAARQPSTRDLAIARIAEALGVSPDRVEARLVQALKDGNAFLFENALKALGNVASALFGLFLFLLALFFFLKDGRRMVAGWENLTPLEADQDRMIRERFSVVCRAVVVSTFLAALVQTGAFAIGLLVIDHVFGTGLHTWVGFLTLLGAIFAMIPFLGVSVVWVPLCLYWAARGEYWAAGLMAFYGGIVIGQVDNLVRILVLRGTADLHPLIGLISILGGMQYLGVAGVFVGPIIAAVLVALLRIVKQEIDHLSEVHTEPARERTPSPSAPDP